MFKNIFEKSFSFERTIFRDFLLRSNFLVGGRPLKAGSPKYYPITLLP